MISKRRQSPSKRPIRFQTRNQSFQQSPPSPSLGQGSRRKLGFFSLIAVVVGTQLGSAMFLLPSQLSPYGLWGLLSWVVTGAGALALCHVFSALAYHSPREGGPHVYVREAFGNRTAFYVGWSYWVISWLSSIPVLVLAVTSLEPLLGPLSAFERLCGESLILLMIMGLNLRGTALSGAGEILFSACKVIPMIVIPWLSWSYWKWDHFTTPTLYSPLTALNASSLLTFWGFVGLEAGTTLVNCVNNPEVVVPRALFMGTCVVILIYALNTLAVMGTLPPVVLQASSQPYGLLLGSILGSRGSQGMGILIFIVCLGTLNSWLLASGQIAMIAAKERLFPSFFGKINVYQSPMMGIVSTTLALFISIILLQSKTVYQQLNELINLSTHLFILIYMMAAFALIKFVIKKQISPRPLLWVSTGVGLTFCGWSILTTPLHILLGSLLIPSTGWVLAWMFKWPTK